MNRAVFLGTIALAFIAGTAASRFLPQAQAQQAGLTPQIIHVPDLAGDALGAANPIGFRSKTFIVADGMTLSVQAGTAHGGTKPDAGSAPIKAIALKTPPQAAEGGTKLLN